MALSKWNEKHQVASLTNLLIIFCLCTMFQHQSYLSIHPSPCITYAPWKLNNLFWVFCKLIWQQTSPPTFTLEAYFIHFIVFCCKCKFSFGSIIFLKQHMAFWICYLGKFQKISMSVIILLVMTVTCDTCITIGCKKYSFDFLLIFLALARFCLIILNNHIERLDVTCSLYYRQMRFLISFR